MIIEVRFLQDDGTLVLEHKATVDNIGTPIQWRPLPGQKIESGRYTLFGFSLQPHVKSNHPSGYQSDPPAFNGILPQPKTYSSPNMGVSPYSAPIPRQAAGLPNPLKG